MKIRNEKSIATIYDAVSILKGLDVVNGSLKQNYYAESALFVPDRFINPLILRPKIDISDPSGSIPNGDKVDELSRLEWFENGVKINSNDDFKIEGANLTIFKNSEEPFEISYMAEWFDTRKKQVITIEDSVVVSCISLAQSDANVTISLSKPQNWVHNPLKGERVYTINAYVSKDKVHESAVEWYYVDSNKNDVLIDETCNFYVGGQYTNALKVDSAYMDNVIIKAKNISNDKLKEVYWFFDKHGNPLTYAMPDKTIIEGSNVFSLPESPITSKLDYRIEGLTLTNLIKNGDFKTEELIGWTKWGNADIPNPSYKWVDGKITVRDGDDLGNGSFYQKINTINQGDVLFMKTDSKLDSGSFALSFYEAEYNDRTNRLIVSIHQSSPSTQIVTFSKDYNSSLIALQYAYGVNYKNASVSSIQIINLTQTFGAGNEPSKEWCDEHIQGYFEGTKSVTAPLRIKSVGENLFNAYDIERRDGPKTDIIDCNTIVVNRGASSYGGDFLYFNLKKGVKYLFSITPDSSENRAYYVFYSKSGDIVWTLNALNNKDTPHIKSFNVDDSGICKLSINNFAVKAVKYYNIYFGIEGGYKPYTESNLYINSPLELKSVGTTKDYIKNGKLNKYISDDGEILEQPEIINLSTQGNLTTYPNGTIFIEPATLVEQQYNDGLQVDLPVKTLGSIKVGKEYLDVSKAVVKDNLITHPELENGDFVTIEYIYDDSPIYGDNSISYLSLEEILDDLWLDNVYTYKVTNGEWELVKVTDIEDYEEWLKTEKTSPYTLAPDGVIFGNYEAETKFIRQYPSSLYVDIIAPTRLKEGITQIKARALVGTADGVIENPSKYFDISWYKKSNKAGASDVIIGEGEELIIDIADVDRIGIEVESKAIKK